MENSSENTTEPNLQTILEAINSLRLEIHEQIKGLRLEMNEQIEGLRLEMNEQIEGLRLEMNEQIEGLRLEIKELKARVIIIETDVSEIKQMQFVFENEFDRLLALSYKSLELSHENRADVRIMRKEIEAWSKTVSNLERQVA